MRRVVGWQDERSLGKVELPCQRLHRPVGQAARVGKDGELIAAERGLRKDVGDYELV